MPCDEVRQGFAGVKGSNFPVIRDFVRHSERLASFEASFVGEECLLSGVSRQTMRPKVDNVKHDALN